MTTTKARTAKLTSALTALQIRYAREAGESIRFFLDGGNDTPVYPGRNEVTGMVLAKLNLLLTRDEHDALLDGAGFEFKRGPMGQDFVALKKP